MSLKWTLNTMLLLVGAVCESTVTLTSGFTQNNLEAIKAAPVVFKSIANYYGCKTWDQDVCLECSSGYAFNKIDVCCQIRPDCRIFNLIQGFCDACYKGYQLIDGQCVAIELVPSRDRTCNEFDANGNCLKCSYRHVKMSGSCVAVDDECLDWNDVGECQRCYQGYVLNSLKRCAVNNPPTSQDDKFCKAWDNFICKTCSERSHFDARHICVEVSDLCKTWNAADGKCLTCFPGYTLTQDLCAIDDSGAAMVQYNLGCLNWDFDKKQCLNCSVRWVMIGIGYCFPVSDFCHQYNKINGMCTSCFLGFQLSMGVCMMTSPMEADGSSGGCAKYNPDNSCATCAFRWFKTSAGCQRVNDYCQTWDNVNGFCTKCYADYNLTNGICLARDTTLTIKDRSCASYNWQSQTCVKCSTRFYYSLQTEECLKVSDFCRTSNSLGRCTGCYIGYILTRFACTYFPETNLDLDAGCSKFNWTTKECLQCAQNYVLVSKRCMKVSDTCRNFDAEGKCTECFSGYGLISGACIASASQMAKPGDQNCYEWNYQTKSCSKCPWMYVSGVNGLCVEVLAICKEYNSNGQCTSCYDGYELSELTCKPTQTIANPDAGCAVYNFGSKKCTKCSARWRLNAAGTQCVALSDQCKSFEENGNCMACYIGYQINDGNCILTEGPKPTDDRCAQWDWSLNSCKACSFWYLFNEFGKCMPVADDCKTFNTLGACLTCFTGYKAQNGVCVLEKPFLIPDQYCAKWDFSATEGSCLVCADKTYNKGGKCQPIDGTCATYDTNGRCLSCYDGFKLKNQHCNVDTQQALRYNDLGCASWEITTAVCIKCSQGYIFDTAGKCQEVSTLCETTNSAGTCLTCYLGYQVKDGKCQLKQPFDMSKLDIGCGAYEWSTLKCIKCAQSYVNIDGSCVATSPSCKTQAANLQCSGCYPGYALTSIGKCQIALNYNSPNDKGCRVWNSHDMNCQQCSSRYWMTSQMKCSEVDALCKDYRQTDGACLSCYDGYSLTNDKCIVESGALNPANLNPGCKTWNWAIKTCILCAAKHININGDCIAISDSCATFDPLTGGCLTCYKGYLVNSVKKCVLDENELKRSGKIDLGCAKWDWSAGVCLICAPNNVFDELGKCQPVSGQCETYNDKAQCLSCYDGYKLSDGQCVISEQPKAPTDVGCSTWDWPKHQCKRCARGWANVFGKCHLLSTSCKQYNENGLCSSCYLGYGLLNGACTLTKESTQNMDPFCSKFDLSTGLCELCAPRTNFNASGLCTPFDNHCKDANALNECVSCYDGYELKNGQCIVEPPSKLVQTNIGCFKWDWHAKKCLECSPSYSMDSNGLCISSSAYCKTSVHGKCTGCYKGYSLLNDVCTLDDLKPDTTPLADPHCNTWDYNTNKCQKCSTGYLFDATGYCSIQVSTLCNTYLDNGKCSSCFKGYILKDGVCSQNNAVQSMIVGCAQYIHDTAQCLRCAYRYYFSASGTCLAVSDLCKDFNSHGKCVSCYTGYNLLADGTCSVVTTDTKDQNCAKFIPGTTVCLQCSTRHVFDSKGICQAVSNLCQSWDKNTGLCRACYNGFELTATGECVMANRKAAMENKDKGCKTWDYTTQMCLECAKRYFFDTKGVCTKISDQCSTYNDKTGQCETCYNGYTLTNGDCVQAALKDLSQKDPFCKQWDYNTDECIKCAERYYSNKEGVCTKYSDHCLSFAAGQNCTSCYKGYKLKEGQCVLTDPSNCRTYNEAAGYCETCYAGYVVLQGECQSMAYIASLYGKYIKCCPDKVQELNKSIGV